MNTLNQILLVVGSLSLAAAFRCQHEKHLGKSTSTQFDIVSQKDLKGKSLWPVSRMDFFLFGSIATGADAKIHAGFYNPDTGFLVYKVIVDCKNKLWKTMYNINKNKEDAKKWKEGELKDGCPEGDFDLIGVSGCSRDNLESEAEDLQCKKHAYFIFNGTVLENDIIEDEIYGDRPQSLPVFLTKATQFKAKIARSGAYFDEEAYGKCFAFPSRYHSSCEQANSWVKARSSSYNGLKSLGAWEALYNVRCEWDADSNTFKMVQDAVIPDGTGIYSTLNKGYKTCCCSYKDGYLDTETCKVNENNYKCDPTWTCDEATYNTTFFR